MPAGPAFGSRSAPGFSRRRAPRFDVSPIPFAATWLSERRTVNEVGTLLDISSGGFGARMIEAPVNGRLLHTRFALPVRLGEAPGTVETEARVCGRLPVFNETTPGWIVHFAIESIHPVDEKHLSEALRLLKAGAS